MISHFVLCKSNSGSRGETSASARPLPEQLDSAHRHSFLSSSLYCFELGTDMYQIEHVFVCSSILSNIKIRQKIDAFATTKVMRNPWSRWRTSAKTGPFLWVYCEFSKQIDTHPSVGTLAAIFAFLSHLLNCGRFWHATLITNFTRSVGRDRLVKMPDLSDNPQSLLWISSELSCDFSVYSYLFDIGRFWYETIDHISQGYLK